MSFFMGRRVLKMWLFLSIDTLMDKALTSTVLYHSTKTPLVENLNSLLKMTCLFYTTFIGIFQYKMYKPVAAKKTPLYKKDKKKPA